MTKLKTRVTKGGLEVTVRSLRSVQQGFLLQMQEQILERVLEHVNASNRSAEAESTLLWELVILYDETVKHLTPQEDSSCSNSPGTGTSPPAWVEQ